MNILHTLTHILNLYAVFSFGGIYMLWIFFLAVMNLLRAQEAKTLSKTAYVLGLPLLIVGVLVDVLCNIFVATILFLELPQEWVVTKRLGRLIVDTGWRGSMARFICQNLLDRFDPSGKHCNCQPTDSK